jgi:hypothetical protein
MKCACCGETIAQGQTTYHSGLYNEYASQPITLCEPCREKEEDCIEMCGSAYLPELLATYTHI